MSKCCHCQRKFSFSDVLKGFNPARIKCGGCSEKIQSSYLVLTFFVIVFGALFILYRELAAPLGLEGQMNKWVVLLVMATLFEFGYFILLDKGIIKSNLEK